MLGTFRPGDCLKIEPLSIAHIRPGDVVAFLAPGRKNSLEERVHRVVAITPEGLVTRGDNTPHADTCFVTAGNLLGRVTHVERGGITRPVRGGRLGLLRARALWTRIHLRNLAVRLGRGPYGWLRDSGLVPRLWQPTVTKIRLATDNGTLVKYVCGGRTVARWWPEEGRFECHRPYDLVISRPTRGSCTRVDSECNFSPSGWVPRILL